MTPPIPLPENIAALVAQSPGAVLLRTSRFDAENYRSYLFLNPHRILTATSSDELPNLFLQIEAALTEGLYLAGHLSYESGYYFQDLPDRTAEPQLPPAWFGVYSEPAIFNHRSGTFSGPPLPPLAPGPPNLHSPAFSSGDLNITLSPSAYRDKILQIKERIAAGDTYQVNFTDRIPLRTALSPAELFLTLADRQPVAYSALIHTGDRHILSFSPELFFRVHEGRIVTRPMKGTWPRGLDATEDALAALQLQNDEKNRSEHLMIVDLLRNDLGRICTTGSIRVDDLFSIERYETLLQMTSTVSGTLPRNLSWHNLFRGLFPSGSITGAPKINTMRIIRELEDAPRGIYTGAIGFIAPSGDATFNVAIRTLVLEDGKGSMGVGGGIVSDSNPDAEYAECHLKAAFLTHSQPPFELLETLLWDDAFTFLSLHLDRLRLSCEYFGFPFNDDYLRTRLNELAATFTPLTRHRVRLTLNKQGKLSLSSSPLGLPSKICRVTLSTERTSSTDVFFRHKTTNRSLYDRLFTAAQRDGFDEVLFLNEKDEVTEGAISNLFIKLSGRLYTPPLSCGVLPGVFRHHLLDAFPAAEERILTLADLRSAEELYLCNSVRGLRRITSLKMAFGTLADTPA